MLSFGFFGAFTTVLQDYYLSPGFCPFKPTFTVEEMFKIQKSIENLMSYYDKSVVRVLKISEKEIPRPTAQNVESEGFQFSLLSADAITDWYSIGYSEEGNLAFEETFLVSYPSVFATALISVAFGVFAGFNVVVLFIFAVAFIDKKTREFVSSKDFYLQMENSGDDTLDLQTFVYRPYQHYFIHGMNDGEFSGVGILNMSIREAFEYVTRRALSITTFVDFFFQRVVKLSLIHI
eukprot:TRINITY_DN22020_c0_g1_i2.p1 TRINITY_DN22020_c0_g1~~TRINITY_DN22020_c0_g1_i2.p1  ORF type:complete len:235 (-),score=28.49 TRINITY_DN22020_c0_g1_i2:60-764(-)